MEEKRGRRRSGSDTLFFLVMGGISSCFVLLIVLMILADIAYTSFADFANAIMKPEIQSAMLLTVLTCTVSAVVSVWVATPLGYLMARYQFPGRWLVSTVIDIPIVLPPLVLGLSLLILFHVHLGDWQLNQWIEQTLSIRIPFTWIAVVLAQYSVACAFAIRTMRITFEQMNPRAEDVARTLGYSRSQAFLDIALPQAEHGIMSAFTVAWARSLGEFGPILVFAGSTRMKTEVLSTSVFLELTTGNLKASVAVSLLMVLLAVCVLLLLRLLGTEPST